MSAPTQCVLSARFPPAWEQIKPLREFITAYTSSAFNAETAAVAAMVVNELLENAVKYGDVIGRVELEVDHHAAALSVRVTNQARAARIEVLQREFSRHEGGSPNEAFSRAVDRLRNLPTGTTMLGLARVMAAAKLDLRVQGSAVTLTAQIARHDPGKRPRTLGARVP